MDEEYYYVDLNNAESRYINVIGNNNKTVSLVPVCILRDNKLYDVITDDEVVYSKDGLYPGLSYYKKQFIYDNGLSHLVERYALLNKSAIMVYCEWLRMVESDSIERYKTYYKNLDEIKKRRLVFKSYLEEEDNGK